MPRLTSRPGLREIERALARVRLRAPRLSGPWTPTTDIVESDDEVVVTAELPGVSDADVDVRVEGGHLLISGHRRQEFSTDEGTYHQRERTFGSFARRFPLPAGAVEDAITAGVAYGVLKVTIPKTPVGEGTARKIPVAGAVDE